MPSLTQLKYILAVDKFRHFQKAASHCHVSQPSMSMQIQKAEQELGVMLFDRTKKPVIPTPEGKAMIEQARVVYLAHQKLLSMSFDSVSKLQGEFKLAVIPTLASVCLPLFLETFHKELPEVDLHLEEMTTQNIVAALREDKIDAGFLATPLAEDGLIERQVGIEPFYVYCHPDHPLSKLRSIDASKLKNYEDVWLLADGHCFKNQIVDFCKIKHHWGPYSHIFFQSASLDTLRYLVQNTRGYTLLPSLFVASLPVIEKEKFVRPLTSPVPSRSLGLIYHRHQWKQKLMDKIHSLLKQTLDHVLLPHARKKNIVIPLS